MARKSSRQGGRFQSSIVARLNVRLFFRLLGIYLLLDLLLVPCSAAGSSPGRRDRPPGWPPGGGAGRPSAEATEWMEAGSYTITAGAEPEGFRLPGWLPCPAGWRG